MIKHTLSWSTVLATSALLLACSSTPLNTPAPVTTATPTPAAPATPPPSAATAPAPAPTAVPEYLDPNSALSTKRSVYFDFDSFVVKDEYRPLVEAHARYLQQNRTARMTIQGNTDERGSREYNIALGQKRAEAVKRMMTLLGATESQIETVSFGKEKPKNPGHDESAYAENRRDDILYAGE